MAATRVVIHEDALQALANSARMRAYLHRVATAGAQGAARRVNVDTGALRDSYLASVRVIVFLGFARATWGSSLSYAIHQEFGTWKMRATPALRPSIDDARQEAEKGW
jgi:hypothetical protein